MTDFAIGTFATDYTLQPAELAKAVEERGFEGLFFAEHTHIPVSRDTPYLLGGDLPKEYWHSHDLFVSMTAAAMATKTLKVGSSICLVTEHDEFNLAKSCASLNMISGGRLVLGIGAGWNAEEMAEHGVPFKDRWKVTRERVLAMRQLWTQDEAEFHGEFVNFEKTWAYPKPSTPGGPPILMGAGSKWTPDRVLEYCDGWMPIDGFNNIEQGLEQLKAAADRAGRPFEELIISPISAPSPRRITELVELGADRVTLFFPSMDDHDAQRERLDHYAEVVRQVTG